MNFLTCLAKLMAVTIMLCFQTDQNMVPIVVENIA